MRCRHVLPGKARVLLGAVALRINFGLLALVLAACHLPTRDAATSAGSPGPRAEAGLVAGTVVQGATVDGGTLEIRILPFDSERLAQAMQGVERQPESADAHAALGDELAKQGRLGEAVGEYAEAARLQPNDPVAHFRLGLTLHVVGDLEAALASYQETARLVPESAWAHAAISIVHLRLGDPVAALKEYRIVRKLDEDLAEGLFEIIAEDQELRQATATSAARGHPS